MAQKRSPKGQLGEADWEVLRAARWAWWSYALPYMQRKSGSQLQHMSVDKFRVHNVLRAAGVEGWTGYDDHKKVYYRLRKLREAGWLKARYRGDYQVTDKTDPEVGVILRDIERDKHLQEQAREKIIASIIRSFDKLVPGHKLKVQSGYTGYGVGIQDMVMSCTGPAFHLQAILRLAEQQVDQLDREFEASLSDDVS